MNSQKLNRAQRVLGVILKISDMHDVAFSETQLELWESALEPYSAEEIEDAYKQHIRDPDPVYRLIPSILTKYIEHGRTNRAQMAFALLQSATRGQANARHNVAFPDPLIHLAVMQTGGWVVAYYAIVDHEQIDDYRINFVRAYERLARGAKIPHPAYLPGREDKPGPTRDYQWIGNEGEVDHVVATGYDPQNPPNSTYFEKPSVPQLPQT